MTKKMNTQQILSDIAKEGGFDNYQHWNEKDLAEWVQANYDCTAYVAKNVAPYLRNGYRVSPNINA